MPPSESGPARNAIGWALLGQAIWLPLLAIALHDRWLSPLPGSLAADPPSGAPLAAAHAEHSAGRSAAQAAPLSLRDLEAAAGRAEAPADAAAAAASPMSPPRAGLVLRSPGLPAGLPEGLPAGRPRQPAMAAAAAAAPVAVAAGRTAGLPLSGGAPQLRPGQRPESRPERPAAAWPGRRSDAPAERASAAPPAGDAARRSVSLSQLLGGAIGLRDLSGAPPGPVASLRPAVGETLPSGAAEGGRRGRQARRVWALPPPLPPLP